MAKKKSIFRKLFSKSDENCCSIQIEEVKKDENFKVKSKEQEK